MSEPLRVVLATDGGSDSRRNAACACIVRRPGTADRIKIVALLGEAENTEAEIAGGLLGLSFLAAAAVTSAEVIWLCDNMSVVDAAAGNARQWQQSGWKNAAGQTVAHRALWQALLELAATYDLRPEHVPGKSEHPLQHACDRACRWALGKGERMLRESGEGPIGRIAARDPALAWRLLDARRYFSDLRAGAAPAGALQDQLAVLGIDGFPEPSAAQKDAESS